MKSKIWPDDTTMVEMDGWLAELREDGAAEPLGVRTPEPPSATRPEVPGAGWAEAPGAEVPGPGWAEAPGAGPAEVPGPGWAEAPSAGPAEAPSAGWAWAAARGVRPAAPAAFAEPAAPAEPAGFAEPAAVAEPAAPAEAVVRPLIGDQLRMPIMWCEMGSCISWHSDPAALGESDLRARAIGAGWRLDAFGRLACPQCQQTDPSFRTSRPVVLWDRATAIARAARIAAMYSQPIAS